MTRSSTDSGKEKQTHWMWFIFPQLASLGRSAMARHFGLKATWMKRAPTSITQCSVKDCGRVLASSPWLVRRLTAQEMLNGTARRNKS